MCVDNAGAHDPNNAVNDRRLTMYWIGWVFFGITITSIFIAGIMVSMYKMNIQDTKMRSSGLDYSDDGALPEDEPYDANGTNTRGGAGGLGTRWNEPRRRYPPPRRQPQRPHRGHSRPTPAPKETFDVDFKPLNEDGHEDPSGSHGNDRHQPSTIANREPETTNRTHGS